MQHIRTLEYSEPSLCSTIDAVFHLQIDYFSASKQPQSSRKGSFRPQVELFQPPQRQEGVDLSLLNLTPSVVAEIKHLQRAPHS